MESTCLTYTVHAPGGIALLEGVHAQGTAEKMLRLKDLLPRVNVSQLVAGCPALLLDYDASALEANLGKLRWVTRVVVHEGAVRCAPPHV